MFKSFTTMFHCETFTFLVSRIFEDEIGYSYCASIGLPSIVRRGAYDYSNKKLTRREINYLAELYNSCRLQKSLPSAQWSKGHTVKLWECESHPSVYISKHSFCRLDERKVDIDSMPASCCIHGAPSVGFVKKVGKSGGRRDSSRWVYVRQRPSIALFPVR